MFKVAAIEKESGKEIVATKFDTREEAEVFISLSLFYQPLPEGHVFNIEEV